MWKSYLNNFIIGWIINEFFGNSVKNINPETSLVAPLLN